jgi:RNA polymerase sigma-70 factor (ECF subfamily)
METAYGALRERQGAAIAVTEQGQRAGEGAYQRVRPYIFSVAYRMTGSASDAEDLVQDAWVRYLAAGSPKVDSLQAYLTTIVSRLALDHLKSARVQRERYVGPWLPEPALTSAAVPGPEATAEQREQVSIAYLTLLDRLRPEQRVVYVLREGFGLAFDEIARHVGKSADACRQIFHRTHARLRANHQPSVAPGPEHRALIEQFLAALATGQVERVAALLADDAVWVSDGGPDRLSARRPVTGADRVSRGLTGFLSKVPPGVAITWGFADLNGAPALLAYDHGALERTITFEIRGGRIAAVRIINNPAKLRHLAAALGTGLADIPATRRAGRRRAVQAARRPVTRL